MTDRELLEAAAKAAGLTIEYWSQEDYPVVRDGDIHVGWSPLKFDSDALRLAVKLDLEIYQADDDGPAVFVSYWGKANRRDVSRHYAAEQIGTDPYAATRRAIVRAAAAMGEKA